MVSKHMKDSSSSWGIPKLAGWLISMGKAHLKMDYDLGYENFKDTFKWLGKWPMKHGASTTSHETWWYSGTWDLSKNTRKTEAVTSFAIFFLKLDMVGADRYLGWSGSDNSFGCSTHSAATSKTRLYYTLLPAIHHWARDVLYWKMHLIIHLLDFNLNISDHKTAESAFCTIFSRCSGVPWEL